MGRELVVEAVVAAIGLAEQIRAGPRGAVDAGVDARLVPARADDAVLDLVERQRLARDGPGGDVPDLLLDCVGDAVLMEL